MFEHEIALTAKNKLRQRKRAHNNIDVNMIVLVVEKNVIGLNA